MSERKKSLFEKVLDKRIRQTEDSLASTNGIPESEKGKVIKWIEKKERGFLAIAKDMQGVLNKPKNIDGKRSKLLDSSRNALTTGASISGGAILMGGIIFYEFGLLPAILTGAALMLTGTYIQFRGQKGLVAIQHSLNRMEHSLQKSRTRTRSKETTGKSVDLLAVKEQALDRASAPERAAREAAVKKAAEAGKPLSASEVMKLRNEEERKRLVVSRQFAKQNRSGR